jgi:hypothetical protein
MMGGPPQPELQQLIYVSTAVAELPEAELQAILSTARRENQAHGISGTLLYADGCFIQVLEGAPDAVTETFERIQLDARHHSVTVLLQRPLAERNFGDWTMGYRRLTRQDLPTEPGFTDFFNQAPIDRRANAAFSLLNTFRQNHTRDHDPDDPLD